MYHRKLCYKIINGKKTNEMIKKLFGQMLLTQILSAMTVVLCMLIDSIMIGHFLGVNAMAAYGLASPVLLIFSALGSMLSAGIQVMSGKTMGNGDKKATDACFSVSVFLAAVISIVGVLIVLLFRAPICTLLGAGEPVPDNEVFRLTKDYLTGFIIGAPAFICAQIMVPFMQMSGNRTRLVVAVCAMAVSNIALNVLNVLVFHGGIFGMGFASSLSYYIALAIGMLYFFRKDCIFKFRLKGIKLKRCLRLIRYGVPTIVNQISYVFLVYLLNKILLSIGQNVAVAAYSVISSVGNICYSFGTGIGNVALMLASMFYSEEDRTSIKSLVKTMSAYAIVLDAIVTLAVILTAPALVTLFLRESYPYARKTTILGVRLFALSLIPCSLNTTFKHYYQGIDRAGLTQAISVMQNFVFTAIFAFALSRFFGTTGVWLSFACGESTTFIVISCIVWITNRKVSFSADAYSLLQKNFGVAPEDCFDASIRSGEEIVTVSRQASEFCRQHGEDSKTRALIVLCIEVMSNNIVKHGFSDGKEHSIDIRLFRKNQEWSIRIRDNCKNFDPVKYLELHKADNSASPTGIRLVMSMVKDANYVNSLGLNNLTLVM